MRYHGGKWRLAPWIISHFPPHRVYVEPYCGAASVLMRKPRSYAEVINDLDEEIVTTFQVLRDPARAAELERQLRLTPWSRREFELSVEHSEDPIECARRTLLRAFMGFGTTSRRPAATGFRGRPYRDNSTGIRDWVRYPDEIRTFVERLQGVCIEARPALRVIAQYDGPDTLFYVDPPYPVSSRTSIRSACEMHRIYRHDMDDDGHRELAETLHQVAGMVVLSGYPCALYDELFGEWETVLCQARADGAKQRTECLWISPRAAGLIRQTRMEL